MSEDSFSTAQTVRHALPGGLVAFIALAATATFFFASQVIAWLAIGIYPLLQHWTDEQTNTWLANSVTVQFIYSVLAYGLLIVGVAVVLRWLRWRWQAIGLRKPKLAQVFTGLAATIPYYLLYLAIVGIASAIFPALNVSQKQDIGFESVHGLIPLFLTFISLVVLPPLAEEITMRGFLYTGLKKWLPGVAAGLLVSLLFGAAHLAEGGDAGPLWIGAIDTFTLSLVLVFLREKTGNLWAGITLHAAKNFIAFAILFILGGR